MLLTTDEVELLKTCDESPEQYIAVFQGQQIGYLRLRHGEFRVDYPDCGDETILYSQEPQGDGCFEEDEREYFLMKAKKQSLRSLMRWRGEWGLCSFQSLWRVIPLLRFYLVKTLVALLSPSLSKLNKS